MNNLSATELAQNKIIILYIINRFNDLLTEEELISFILRYDIFNYFYFKEYLNELLSSKLVEINSEEKIFLTDTGKESLNFFTENINEDLKSTLDGFVNKFRDDKVNNNSVSSSYYKDDEGIYYCLLSINEQNREIFNLKIEAPNEDYAISICETFKNSPQKLFKNIIMQFSE
ncbi:DUF4364 family protein [Peptoniphilus catoniae]|uniref:DUF4364 family protein n=1 Tax=Peptoniphilus catoniae TaxID=1660341 RepID=UPI0010FEF356|nr:DUF4364 family protein [Peptoniphilus catoniae]